MNKLILIALFVFLLGAVGLGLLVSNSDYTYQAKDGRKLVITKGGELTTEEIAALKEETERNRGKNRLPKAVIKETSYDFGMMDPLTMGRHVFVIRNAGTGNLELTKESTTCKCTLSKLSNGIVRPGEQAEVELTWNTGKHEFYRHGAEIRTNDPFREIVKLEVSGTVRTLLGATRKELVFSEINPDESASIETIVYSQSMDDFSFEDVSTTIEGLTWEIEPADEETIDRLEALAAYKVRVTTPADMPSGQFSGALRFMVKTPLPPAAANDAETDDDANKEKPDDENTDDQPPADDVPPPVDDEKPSVATNASGGSAGNHRELLELTVAGRVLRRLEVYGKSLETGGVVNLGIINQGEGAKTTLFLRVRDPQYEIPVKSLEVEPQFVKAKVETNSTAGFYNLEIEVPADAPMCQHVRGSRRGRLQLTFDHPRIERLDLSLSFAVVPSGL